MYGHYVMKISFFINGVKEKMSLGGIKTKCTLSKWVYRGS